MKNLDEQLRQEGSEQIAGFSQDRHDVLMRSLVGAPARSAEAPLRTLREIRYAGVAIAVALISSAGIILINRQGTTSQPAGDFAAPMRVAENSIQRVQMAAVSLSNDPSAPLLKQADDVFGYFAKQVALAESLAVSPPSKPRV